MTKKEKDIVNKFLKRCLANGKGIKIVHNKRVYVPVEHICNNWRKLIKEFKIIGVN